MKKTILISLVVLLAVAVLFGSINVVTAQVIGGKIGFLDQIMRSLGWVIGDQTAQVVKKDDSVPSSSGVAPASDGGGVGVTVSIPVSSASIGGGIGSASAVTSVSSSPVPSGGNTGSGGVTANSTSDDNVLTNNTVEGTLDGSDHDLSWYNPKTKTWESTSSQKGVFKFDGSTVGIGSAPTSASLSVAAAGGSVAIDGRNTTGTAFIGHSEEGVGIRGSSNGFFNISDPASIPSVGVFGRANSGVGLYGFSNTGVAVRVAGGEFGLYQQGLSSKNFFEGKVGIGTRNPATELDVNGRISVSSDIGTALSVRGQVGIFDGTQGAGKVLTSNSAGLASWQMPAEAGSEFWAGIEGDNIYNINSGNVSIGAASRSSAKLFVTAHTNNPAVRAENNGGGTTLQILNGDGGVGIQQVGGDRNYFEGDIGIGVQDPAERLDLGGGNIKMGHEIVSAWGSTTGGRVINVFCPEDKFVIGGGCEITDDSGSTISISSPIDLAESASGSGGWSCKWSGGRGEVGVAKAICANIR
ncbi:MAG: hypothetical protein U9M92_03045 [Patescibacteria group bacterium]|nr:hypothetical protein [Patescibacteria group bacterium]